MNRFYKYFLPLLLCVIVVSCSKDNNDTIVSETNFESYSIKGYPSKAVIDKENKTIFLQLPETVTSGTALCPEFTLSDGAVATINYEVQKSGTTFLDFSGLVLYTVSSADGTTSSLWKVTVTNNDYTGPYGMGNFLTESYTNNAKSNRDFYLEQQHSGSKSDSNCGPAVATMALWWAYPTFKGTVEQARNEIPYSEIDGGLFWYPRDVYNYLSNHGLNAYYWNFYGASYEGFVNTISRLIREGNLVIVCINMANVSEQKVVSKEYRTHKYYSGGQGHFLVVKGYRIVNGVTWFEVNDPWGLDKKYSDGTYYGANRYYLGTDIATSIDWNYWSIVVPPLS